MDLINWVVFVSSSLKMGRAIYIFSAVLGSFAAAWACDHLFADKKIFGGKLIGLPFQALSFAQSNAIHVANRSNRKIEQCML